LKLKERPDFPSQGSVSFPSGIFWKTGTSFGNRDAWAVGAGERYTVAVWLGNLDNTASSQLVGAEAAAPILFELMDALDDRAESADLPPAELRPIEICVLSGHPATEACTETRMTLARYQKVPIERCPLHQQIFLSEHGLRTHPGCGTGTQETRVFWPASVRRWLGSRYSSEAEAPPWQEGCNPAPGSPKIQSPDSKQTILLLPGVPLDRQEIPLEATGGEAPYTWFVDGVLLQSSQSGERVWWEPKPGAHQLLVQDSGGGTDSQMLNVRLQ
jgi:penicillin-binding protein 1C